MLRSDLTTDGNRYRLHIKASKTDPFHLGVDLFLRQTHHSVCPVKALKNYLACSRALDLPLFSHADRSFLTPLRLTSMLQSYTNWVQRRPLCMSQLPDRSSNNCSNRWPARLADQNFRSLVFRLLPTILPTEWQGPLFCGKRAR